jgi:hypothetical protein
MQFLKAFASSEAKRDHGRDLCAGFSPCRHDGTAGRYARRADVQLENISGVSEKNPRIHISDIGDLHELGSHRAPSTAAFLVEGEFFS